MLCFKPDKPSHRRTVMFRAKIPSVSNPSGRIADANPGLALRSAAVHQSVSPPAKGVRGQQLLVWIATRSVIKCDSGPRLPSSYLVGLLPITHLELIHAQNSTGFAHWKWTGISGLISPFNYPLKPEFGINRTVGETVLFMLIAVVMIIYLRFRLLYQNWCLKYKWLVKTKTQRQCTSG